MVTVLREALEIYIELGDRELMGKAFNELADSLFSAGRLEEAAETARLGLSHLTDVSAHRARLFATLGNVLTVAQGFAPARDCERARTLGSEALEIYSRIGMRRQVELAQSLLDKAAGQQRPAGRNLCLGPVEQCAARYRVV
jgi:hypothetical protein